MNNCFRCKTRKAKKGMVGHCGVCFWEMVLAGELPHPQRTKRGRKPKVTAAYARKLKLVEAAHLRAMVRWDARQRLNKCHSVNESEVQHESG